MWFAGIRVEDEDAILAATIEVKHIVDRAGDGIERPSNALAAKPVILNKTDNRALIRRGVIHEVSPGVR